VGHTDGMGSDERAGLVRLTAVVHGYVQGVGFRWSTMAVAQSAGVVGFAENRFDGDVQVVAEGTRESCQKVLDWLRGSGSRAVRRPGRVESVDATWGQATGEFRRFSCY
jgi:acylphosphatase